MKKIEKGFQEVSGHIDKIDQWQNSIHQKEFEVSRIIANDIIEKFKNSLSRESLGILELKVADMPTNEYITPSKQSLSVLEYLCLIALRRHNSAESDEKVYILSTRFSAIVPENHVLLQIPEDRIGLHVIAITEKTQELVRLDMYGKLENHLLNLEGCFNYLK